MNTSPLKFEHFDPSRPSLVLIDTSVFQHDYDQRYAGVDHKHPDFMQLLKANMVALANLSWLPMEIVETVVSVIFTLDIKQDFKYWRHDWLLDPSNYLRVPKRIKRLEALRREALVLWEAESTVEPEVHAKLAIHYKAGRSLPTYRLRKIKQRTAEWVGDSSRPLNASGVGVHYYESDDLMAAIVCANRDAGSPYNIIIYTVDVDLIGLVDESVTWVCMHGYHPGIRDTIDTINSWGNKPDATGKVKLGEIQTWTDIWVRKSEVGDPSDSLPASKGVLLPVIDLIDPPSQHRLIDRPEMKRHINKLIGAGSPADTAEASRAVRFITNKGFLPCFKSYANVPLKD